MLTHGKQSHYLWWRLSVAVAETLILWHMTTSHLTCACVTRLTISETVACVMSYSLAIAV